MIIKEKLALSGPPKFIVFEGVNGAGKSTLIDSLAQHLTHAGASVVRTFEPGATDLGKRIRPLILEAPKGSVSELAELFLFSADRNQHVEKVIRPAIYQGNTILCDRYFYSTLAFQGYGRGLPMDIITEVSNSAIAGVVPDLVVLLDLDPEEGLRRIRFSQCSVTSTFSKDGGHPKDGFEDEEISFHNRIRSGFLNIAADRPEPFIVLDATRHPKELFEEVVNYLT